MAGTITIARSQLIQNQTSTLEYFLCLQKCMLRSASYVVVVVQVRRWDTFNCYNHLYLQFNSLLLFTSHDTMAYMSRKVPDFVEDS